MKTILTLTSILVMGILTMAEATSFGPPEDRVIKSPNGQFSLAINTNSGRHEVRKGNKIMWSFERRLWHDEFFLSNDGQRVLWVAWEHVQTDDAKGWKNRQADAAQQEQAIVVYSPDGVLLKKTFGEVSVPKKPEGPGPIGDFWRVWREAGITQDGDVVSIPVTGKKGPFKIDMSKIQKP